VEEMLVCFYLIANIISIGFSLFMATSELQVVDILFLSRRGKPSTLAKVHHECKKDKCSKHKRLELNDDEVQLAFVFFLIFIFT
jgi:hypothetical protein